MAALPVLRVLDDWPVPNAAAAVVGREGVLATHGDTERQFALASVTKPLVARAAQVAIEEGAVELDTAAGPPGSASAKPMLSPRGGRPRGPRKTAPFA